MHYSWDLEIAMTRMRSVMLLCVLLIAPPAFASELLAFTFFQQRPFSGLVIELDGQRIGETDAQGAVKAELEAGAHTLRCLKDGALLAREEFIVAAGESAEISIGFTDFKAKPKVSVATFDENTPNTSPTGFVRGVVTSIDGNPVAAATITTTTGGPSATTNAAGKFDLELPRGTYQLQVSHPDYETATGDAIRIVSNVGVAAAITLRSSIATAEDGSPEYTADDFADVEEVEVVGTFNPTEDAADLEKFSVAITDSISIEDLLRFGDSDVASALKRIVGVAVTGGKYANVRGLDGRYISSTMNGSLMPSTDPYRRDVQLDLFPSEILGGIDIQKSFTADLPGDTTGGIIRMTSRDIPDEDVAGISVSLGYINGVTGEDLYTYEGSDSDVIGIDDGLRELPAAFRRNLSNGNYRFRICQFDGQQDCVSQAEGARLAGLLPAIYNPKTETAGPNLGVAGKYGRRLEWESGDLGFYGSLTYDQGQGSRQDARFDDPDRVGTKIWDSFQASLNGYFVAGWRANSGWDLTSKTIVLRDSEDRTTIETGFAKKDEVDEQLTVLEWVERQFLGQQMEATLPLFSNHEMKLRAGVTQTNRLSPDRREYQYRNGVFIASTLERSYSDLTEDGLDFGMDYQWPVSITDGVFMNLRFGVLANSRERDNELIRLGVLTRSGNDLDPSLDLETLLRPINFENDYYRLNTNKTTETDSYDASQDTTAVYVSTETDLGTDWTVVAGARFEQYSIDLNYPNDPDPASSKNSDRDSDNVLPGLSVNYRWGDNLQLRAGYGQTVSRPNITELADSRFYDQEGRQYIGCPNCTDSTIDNFDIRGEYYFGDKDSITLALFYKNIDSPLERAVSDGSGSAVSALTFRNSQSATLHGLELDASSRVYDGIDNVITLSGNIALINSEISLDSDGVRLEGRSSRELQGQSPFLANIQFALDNYEWDTKLTIVANYFDDRIDAVARAPLGPIYESGRIDINLNGEKAFRGGSKISFKLKNLLNEPIERTQDGRVIDTYKKGMSLSLGYSLSF